MITGEGGGGGGLLNYIGMCESKGVRYWPFWSQIRYGFCTVVFNWVCVFLEEATYSSLSITPSAKALHNVFTVGLNKVTNFKADLKQGIDLASGLK